MDFLDELLNINNDVYGIIKVVVAVSGFIALLLKIREAFSDRQRRQTLKTDLEILEIAQRTSSSNIEQIKEKTNSEINYLFDKENYTSGGVLSFIIGLIVSIGFSLWTINIFQNSEGFNPWTILTMFIAGIGMTNLLGFDNKRKTKGEFFRIEFHDNQNFRFGLIIGSVALICFAALIIIYKRFTWGLFVSALFILIGYFGTIKNIKFKRIKNKN